MKDRHEYKKIYIGTSDIAALIFAGFGDTQTQSKYIHFGKDDTYQAYIVDGECEIPNYYEQVAEFQSWLKVFDDKGLTFETEGDEIKVYRAAEMGCIIQVINYKEL